MGMFRFTAERPMGDQMKILAEYNATSGIPSLNVLLFPGWALEDENGLQIEIIEQLLAEYWSGHRYVEGVWVQMSEEDASRFDFAQKV